MKADRPSYESKCAALDRQLDALVDEALRAGRPMILPLSKDTADETATRGVGMAIEENEPAALE